MSETTRRRSEAQSTVFLLFPSQTIPSRSVRRAAKAAAGRREPNMTFLDYLRFQCRRRPPGRGRPLRSRRPRNLTACNLSKTRGKADSGEMVSRSLTSRPDASNIHRIRQRGRHDNRTVANRSDAMWKPRRRWPSSSRVGRLRDRRWLSRRNTRLKADNCDEKPSISTD